MFLQKLKGLLFPQKFLTLSFGKKTAYTGMFMALVILANILSIDISPSFKITFTYFISFFTGLMLGPLVGFFVCFFGDIIAFLLPLSGGVYWPLTGICSGLLAFIPGMVMNNLHFSIKGGVYIKAIIAMVITYLLVTCSLGAYANYLYVKLVIYAGKEYTTAFGVYLAGKILFSSIVAWLNYILVLLTVPTINSIKSLKLKIE